VLELAHPTDDRDLLLDILVSATRLATDDTDRLDLKITAATLREMRAAFRAFAPYRHVPKITMFGSARTRHDDPLYAQARDLAHQLASHGWMVVTGAGPGIMQAGMEGAGRASSFGVSIRLPFETNANAIISGDQKLVSMKYFFTRKLMLMKESAGFVALPGGFGTLDETFELLTLQQTGKAVPAPIVLLDVPGGTYWHAMMHLLRTEVETMGLISPGDLDLVRVTDHPTEATRSLLGFFRNYHSIRWVGNRLVLRLKAPPTDAEVQQLNDRFGELCTGDGRIERTDALPDEVTSDDVVDLPRLVMPFDIFRTSELHRLIGGLNALPSAPPSPV
jgi:uncharacterized protein (TIGR00730 family)